MDQAGRRERNIDDEDCMVERGKGGKEGGRRRNDIECCVLGGEEWRGGAEGSEGEWRRMQLLIGGEYGGVTASNYTHMFTCTWRSKRTGGWRRKGSAHRVVLYNNFKAFLWKKRWRGELINYSTKGEEYE